MKAHDTLGAVADHRFERMIQPMAETSSASLESRREIDPELARDERLLWSGRPRQGFLLRGSDAYMIPFSLMWGGFAFFWEMSVFSKSAPIFFRLWGVPFVLMGVYMIIGRFFADRVQRARTFYGVTDQRVLIVGGLFERSVKSLTLTGLGELSLDERGDRSGTIRFGASAYPQRWGATWPGVSRTVAPMFELIEDARRVHDLVRETQRANQT